MLAFTAAVAMAAILTATGARLCALGQRGLNRHVCAPVHFLLGAGPLAVLLTAEGLARGLSRGVAIGVFEGAGADWALALVATVGSSGCSQGAPVS